MPVQQAPISKPVDGLPIEVRRSAGAVHSVHPTEFLNISR
jgi:hypothetical protein